MKSVLLGDFIQIFSPGCGNPAEPAVDKELVLPFHDHVHCSNSSFHKRTSNLKDLHDVLGLGGSGSNRVAPG